MTRIFPWRLVTQIAEFYPGSAHVKSVLSVDSPDAEIWAFARMNGFAIVSKGDDFEQRSILLGHPPKVIWIRVGNCRTQQIADLLIGSLPLLIKFERDEEKSLFPIP